MYQGIKRLIMNAVIAPGERLNIDSLARELGTSSSPVREALARLESDGLATKLPLRGYTVTLPLSRAQLDDLYELRLLIEPWAAGRAARRLDDSGRERLAAELERAGTIPESTDYQDFRDFSDHDARLHDLVLDLAGNQAVRESMAKAHAHLHMFRIGYDHELGSATMVEHRLLVAKISSGSDREAEQTMRDHLESARSRLRRRIPEGPQAT